MEYDFDHSFFRTNKTYNTEELELFDNKNDVDDLDIDDIIHECDTPDVYGKIITGCFLCYI